MQLREIDLSKDVPMRLELRRKNDFLPYYSKGQFMEAIAKEVMFMDLKTVLPERAKTVCRQT